VALPHFHSPIKPRAYDFRYPYINKIRTFL
jgi:hypothetical protein